MAIKRVIGLETEYGLFGGDPYDLVSAHKQKGGSHFNACVTNRSVIRGLADRRPREGDYVCDHLSSWGGVDSWYGSGIDWDRMLINGARLYVDLGHPEYATPECTNPVDLVIYDKAGEQILANAMKKTSPDAHLFKNNSDGKGHSYGCHENYTITRLGEEDFKNKLVPAILPYLVTRQVFTGAGKLGIEIPADVTMWKWLSWYQRVKQALTSGKSAYQLSQRADFIEEVMGLQTTYDRPIVNTRDEPHADLEKYMRLHLICGDANMSEIATYLKTGITALILDGFEDGILQSPPALENPVKAFKEISKDQTYQWLVRDSEGKTISALDIQRFYLDWLQVYKGRDEITDDLLGRWEYVLDTLKEDPMKLSGWLDWVAKKSLMQPYANSGEKDTSLANIDLAYHDIDQERGLFYLLQREGLTERLVDDYQIINALGNPPEDTRAWFRGQCVRYGGKGANIDWGEVEVRKNGKPTTIKMIDPLSWTKNDYINGKLGDVIKFEGGGKACRSSRNSKGRP